MQKNKYIILSFISFCFISIFLYGSILSINIRCDNEDYKFTINKNASVHDISLLLEDKICINPMIFKLSLLMTFNQKKIKYGRYDLRTVGDIKSLIRLLTSVNSERVRVTLIEGLRVQEIALELENKMDIDVETFISLCYESQIIKGFDLGDNVNNLEGFLYPDTYLFLKTYTEYDIINILVKQFKKNYKKYINKNTEMNMYDTVILASIIQGESKYKNDMDTISSVYHNRLNKNMLLQADPTIQYILPVKKKRVMYKDTKIENPYNTYMNKGLPPGPINNPGINSIMAAAMPPDSEYLFFVADGQGTHIFNKTYNEHLKSKKNVSRKSK